ncbi:MAG TPA: aminoglycoside phosphotransferase family protein [Polyangiaceae bacterium]|nr:aminoglycoside phosphotransferase family protein [Polyangiaceae bacterium]
MVPPARACEPIERFAQKVLSTPAEPLEIAVRPLHGGLVSGSVQWVIARHSCGRHCTFVAKRLDGTARREAGIHRTLMTTPVRPLAPALLGLHEGGTGADWLFLEALSPLQAWPWHDLERAGDVLRSLAHLHALRRASRLGRVVRGWDYERELRDRGERLVELLEQRRPELRPLGLAQRAWFVRRFVERLSSARRRMLDLAALPPTLIHGDVHSGNVLLCARGGQVAPVFLDWGRARIGSPLEDVSSWLQSLGYWEPQARQRHDTLLRAYLSARGQPWPPTPELRCAYWVAAACNSIAGAAEWHLHRAVDPALRAEERSRAAAALLDHLRVVRRAYAYERQVGPRHGTAGSVTSRSALLPGRAPPVPRRSTASAPARPARARG